MPLKPLQLPASIRANAGLLTQLQLAPDTCLNYQERWVGIRTPDCPDYYFGNYLLLEQRPTADQIAAWSADFEDLLGSPERLAHRAFVWPEAQADGPPVDLPEGYDYQHLVSMRLPADAVPQAPALPEGLTIRRFEQATDWQQWRELQADVTPGSEQPEAHRRYLDYQARRYRSLCDSGLGDWWGVFAGEELLAYLGLYRLGRLGRFQAVTTRPDWRRRGLCQALLGAVLQQQRQAVEAFVIVAEGEHHAQRLYAKAGFVVEGGIGTLLRTGAGG
ncbi:GNAT family N-acetyltransferase [Pseudomonas oryzihabitans]|uniref:GNAT family N-acetyltransferase n=1 Tax=Pseudomonas oryzihabitans TaxID=47885 RepID=UPI00286531C5|nr:GNAT family N-acetyltransferase [Pseudomonas psychrotolerans]MDR6675879.1 ribosomal protein S18 acetylase RimI-like enzyme [Pseudomonas psychrotolerans]